MPILTDDIKAFVRRQKLGFVATVCPDGTPNLSPKGTTTVWDDDHLVFADIHSPGSVENIRNNPSIEINIVDIFNRKGYRFKGNGMVYSDGSLFEEVVSFYRSSGSRHIIKNIVLVKIERVLPIYSPAYDNEISEAEVINRWVNYYHTLH
ncbi:MAG: pyridoxamine 5'-phosphate oxidase family protein [Flavisolibacter sp.]